LYNVIDVFQSVSIGNGSWKPIQTGVILATKTIIDVTFELLDKYDYYFVLTGRMNQDCVENLFSQIRIRDPTPSPLSFTRFLKQICISQYLFVPSSSNYHADDSYSLTDLLSVNSDPDSCVSDISLDDLPPSTSLAKNQEQALYYLIGYCTHSICKSVNLDCDACLDSLLSSDENDEVPNRLTLLREYKKGSLVKVSPSPYKMFYDVECMFRRMIRNVCSKSNVKSILLGYCDAIASKYDFPYCHDIHNKIMSKFVDLRLKIFANIRSKEMNTFTKKCTLASKSVAM
jgi:hypothetical protein